MSGKLVCASALLAAACRAPEHRSSPPPAEAPPEAVAADTRPPATPGPAEPPTDVLRVRGGQRLRAWRPTVHIYSNGDYPFERLADVAQETYERASRWLGVDPAGAAPVGLFLCDSPDELARFMDDLPLRGAVGIRRRVGGGYFRERRVIAVVVEPERNTEWLVSHETWHVVFRDIARRHPVALNEGLAEVLPSWILFGDAGRPEDNVATYDQYESVLAQLVEEDRVPAVGEFLELGVDAFHASRWENFALSWSLAKLLMESDDPALCGRLPRLIHALGGAPSVWDDFDQVYDEDRVQALWAAELARFAPPPEHR